MKEKNVIEVCVGVGMDQIFPETTKIIIDGEKPLETIVKDEDRDYDKYYYFEL